MTHICIGNVTIIGSDNGLSPGRRQTIIWTNVGILLIEPLGTNFSEIVIEIITFSVKKMHLKMSSGNWRLFCLGLNELIWKLISWSWDFVRSYSYEIDISSDIETGPWFLHLMPLGTQFTNIVSLLSFMCYIFQGEHKYIFIFCVIHLHWYDTGS